MTSPNEPNFDDPLTSMMRGWTALAGALGWPGTGAEAWLGGARALAASAAPVNGVLLQAQGAASAAMLRGAQRGAESWATYLTATQALDSATEGAAPWRRVDEARAHLRRLAEIAHDEARVLESQLRALDEQLRQATAPPASATDGPPRRYARAKD